MSSWTLIKTTVSQPEADVIKGLLEQNGIAVNLQADTAGGLQPGLAVSSGIRLHVRDEDVAKARELLTAASRE